MPAHELMHVCVLWSHSKLEQQSLVRVQVAPSLPQVLEHAPSVLPGSKP
jgi:hypothetical protein